MLMADFLEIATVLALGANQERSFADRAADRLSVTDFKNDDGTPVLGN
jgi:hypothetical protein